MRIIAANGGGSTALLLASARLSTPVELAAEQVGTTLLTVEDWASAEYMLGDLEWRARVKRDVERCGPESRLWPRDGCPTATGGLGSL